MPAKVDHTPWLLGIKADHIVAHGVFKRAKVPALTPAGTPLPPANAPLLHATNLNALAGPGHYEPPQLHQPPVSDSSYPPSHHPHNYNQAPIPAPQARPIDGGDKHPNHCIACKNVHKVGYCPIKLAGPEKCNLCGIAHFGHARVCPHIASITQLRAMLEALKHSTEPDEEKTIAKNKITGILGDLNQRRRRAKEAQAQKEALFHAQNARVNGIRTGKENSTPNTMSHLFHSTPHQGR